MSEGASGWGWFTMENVVMLPLPSQGKTWHILVLNTCGIDPSSVCRFN